MAEELSEFISYEEQKNATVLLIDTNNLSMRCLFALAYDPTDINFTMYKNAFLMSLRKSIKQFQPNRIIFCQEGFHNWRKALFTDYKCSRAPGREASPVDFDAFFKMNNEFIDDLSKVMKNALFLQIPQLEADDLIAMTAKYMKKWNIIAISTDKDFYQLHKYKNFKQWDPIKHKFVEVLNPHTALMQKIITGDKSDDIPQLKRGVGPKTVEKILAEGTLDEWLKENGLVEKFDRNRQLVDFDFIPEEFVPIYRAVIENWKQGKFDGRQFFNFVVKHGLGLEAEHMDETIEIFSQVFTNEKVETPTPEPLDEKKALMAKVDTIIRQRTQSMDDFFLA